MDLIHLAQLLDTLGWEISPVCSTLTQGCKP
jgi:hypothetical protein